jgi:hypothetical protein
VRTMRTPSNSAAASSSSSKLCGQNLNCMVSSRYNLDSHCRSARHTCHVPNRRLQAIASPPPPAALLHATPT